MFTDLEIGQFVKSSNPTPKYNEPGGASFVEVKPHSYIGKIKGLNSKKNWALLSDDNWINYNAGMYFSEAKELTEAEKEKAKEQGALAALGSTPQGSAIIDTGNAVISATTFLSKYLKWIIIAILAIVLLAVFIRISGK